MLQGRHVGANFPKSMPLLEGSAFLAALPGAERRDCAHPPKIWLVETENSEAPSHSNTLYYNARANRCEKAMRLFQKIFHKIVNISPLARSISMKTVQDGVKAL